MDDPIIPIYELTKSGRSGGLIDHDPRDENQLLGVLLQVQQIGNAWAGQFFTAGLPKKVARVEISSSDCMKQATLIKFNKKEYIEKLETSFGEQFSKASFKCLHHSQFYEGFCVNEISKTFWTKLVNHDVTAINFTENRRYRSFDHFIFGRVLFNRDNEIICQKSYDSIPVESNILTDIHSFNSMQFVVNFSLEEKCQSSFEKGLEEGRSETSGDATNKESNDELMIQVEKLQVDVMTKNVERTSDRRLCKKIENDVDTATLFENKTDHKETNVEISESTKEPDSTAWKKLSVDIPEIEKKKTNETVKCEVLTNTDCVHQELMESNQSVDKQKNEEAKQSSASNAIENNKLIIDHNDEDTIYGILWGDLVRSPEETQIRIFCMNMPDRSVFVKIPINQQVELGDLVKFSKAEYQNKLVKKTEAVSVTLTQVPDHGLFHIEKKFDDRHLVSLHNYKISSITETPEHYSFEHDILGVIEDGAKRIRTTTYKEIQLRVTKPKNSSKNIKFSIYDVFEEAVMTEEETNLRQLPMETRCDYLPGLLRLRQENQMDEEKRNWEIVGTLVVKKIVQLGGIEGDALYLVPEKGSKRIVSKILKDKHVSAYLLKPEFNGDFLDNLPNGLIFPHLSSCCFVPAKKYRNMPFEVGARFKLIPKTVERNMDYFEKNRSLENNVLRQVVHALPKLEKIYSEKLKNMYTSEVISDDPELLEEEFTLNDQQQKAVRMALNETRKIVLIHGPPGTGKTHTLAEVIYQYVLREQKILVIAPTHCAIETLYEAAAKQLVERGFFRRQNGMPTLITYDTFNEEAKKCGLTENLEELKQQMKKKLIEPDEYKTRKDQIKSCVFREFVENALACFCTTNSSFLHIAKQHGFQAQTAIVDEAGMVLETDLWSAIHSINRVVMAGDPKLLPPVVNIPSGASTTEIGNLQESVMERLMRENENNHNYIILSVQFRMHPDIMRLSSELFYKRQLQADESVKNTSLLDLFDGQFNAKPIGYDELRKPVVFCDTATSDNGSAITKRGFDKLVYLDQDGHQRPSYSNPGEAIFVMRYLALLIHNKVQPSKISIITPYKAQVREIKKVLENNRETYNENIKVGTVDSFQGKENDIIIVSLVRYNPKRSVGFLLDEKRLNALLTRARKQIFLIGHSSSILFNEQGNLPQLSEILISTNSVVSRVLLNQRNKTYEIWEKVGKPVDRFGKDFEAYLNFNPDDEEMRLFVEKFLENKRAVLALEENDSEEEEEEDE